MAKKEKEEVKKQTPEETPQEAVEETPKEQAPEEPELPQADPWEEKYNSEHDARLRLAAEYDNFRKRTTKEKEQSYGNGKADAVTKMLPIYDNLERALNQPTEDAAYKKGVELTMTELLKNFCFSAYGIVMGMLMLAFYALIDADVLPDTGLLLRLYRMVGILIGLVQIS